MRGFVQELHELGIEPLYARLEHALLAELDDVRLELRLRLVVHLFDPRRVDAPVFDQLHERELRRFAANAVEGGQDDCLWRVVDDEIDAGEVLECADVPTLAPDDPPFHIVGRQLDERHGRLCRV